MVVGDASDIKGYDRRSTELSNAPPHLEYEMRFR